MRVTRISSNYFDLICLCLIGALLIVVLGGCAGKVGSDNSDDIKNENTNLKVQITQLQIEKKQLNEANTGVNEALRQCYKSK